MDLILYTLGALITLGAGALLMPGGMAVGVAVFAWVRDSRIAQAVALAAVGLLAILAVRRDGVKAGKAEALHDVEKANRRAVERRQKVDDAVAKAPDESVRDELKSWSR